MSKKWYNFFITTEEVTGAEEEVLAPARPSTRIPERVVDAIPEATAKAVFTAPVGNPASFDDLYRSAQIPVPAHGYTILKVAEMLQSEHIRTLPAEVKKKSILVALDAARVKVREVVEDAVARDRALDTYEKVLQKNLDDIRGQKEKENLQLEAEIQQRVAELKTRIAENNREIEKEQASLVAWRTGKRLEEERIADAVGYFVTENPVTTPGPSQKERGGENVR